MNCKLFQRKVGRLHPDLELEQWPVELRRHLDECEACSLVYARVNQVMAIIEDEKQQAVNPFIYTRIEQAINKPALKPAWYLRKAILHPALLLVFAMAMISLGVFSGKQVDKALNASNQNITTDEQVQLLAREYYFKDPDAPIIDTTLLDQ
jgi:predicted anti-sigma-YlaC factor YlaD